jgi:hypothetical protein
MLQIIPQPEASPHDAAHHVMAKRPKNLAGKCLIRHQPRDEIMRRLKQQHVIIVV